MITKRFYVFTGKGGVGKTTLALAFAKFLQSEGRKVLFTTLEEGFDQGITAELLLDFQVLNLQESTKIYLARKLGTQVVASWIVSTHFFKAMFQMVPGFSYLIYLGQILDNLRNDPDLVVILDSPASGHVLTMFESLQTFKEIFQSGILFEDILEMLKMIYQENFLKINICTIPTFMAVQEALELSEALKKLNLPQHSIYANNCLLLDSDLKSEFQLPDFLDRKLQLEKEVFDQFGEKIQASLPHIPSLEYAQIIKNLIPFMKNLL